MIKEGLNNQRSKISITEKYPNGKTHIMCKIAIIVAIVFPSIAILL